MGNIVYAAVILIAGILCAVVAHVIYRRLQKKADLSDSKLDDILLLAFGRPVIILILFFSVFIAVNYYVDLPAQYAWILSSKYIISLYILIAAWVVSTFSYNIVHIYGRSFALRSETDVDDQIIELLEIATKYIVWFIAILIILSYLEFDITPLVAGAGILGLAFALAAQDILSNFFGGAMITVDKPFKLGDRVKVEGYVGDIVEIGPRSTRMLTVENMLVTIPNSKIASNIVVNFTAPEPTEKIRVAVSVAYGSDLAKVREILMDIGQQAAGASGYILPGAQPEVFLREFGDSGISFILVTWAKAYNLTLEAQDYLNMRIYERFAKEGIEIPFPQMDVHLKQE
jgi:MscS family membrane protein